MASRKVFLAQLAAAVGLLGFVGLLAIPVVCVAAPALDEVPETGLSAAPESLLQNKFVWASAAIVILMILVLLFR